ncbi:MAG: hypothetical protein ACK5KL_03865 [Dysgonomonas sp.]
MRKVALPIIISLLFCLSACNKHKNGCDMRSEVSLGSLDYTTWIYKNEGINIEWKLPHGWYTTEVVGESADNYTTHSVRIGDEKDKKTPPYSITLSDLKKTESKNSFTMFFAITKDSVGSDINIKTPSMYVGLIFSEKLNPIKDLELIEKRSAKMRGNNAKLIESAIKEGLPVGDWEQPYWEATSEDSNDGTKSYGIVSLKDYGCYNFYIMATYFNEGEKEEILEILKNNISTINN